MIRKIFLVLTAFCLIYAGCSSAAKNKKEFLSSIDSHETAPAEAVLNGEELYIKYVYQNTDVYLKAVLPKNLQNSLDNYARAQLSAAKEIKNPSAETQRVIYVAAGFDGIIKDFFKTLLPKGDGTGVIIIVQGFEGALYRDKNGKPDFKLLTEMPEDIEITGRINESQFTQMFLDALKKDSRLAGISQTKFLLPTQSKSTEPYIYLDLEKNLVVTLTLPEYFELKKQMSELGFSTSFIYSFLIKSHIFGIIKAPFTSVFRLLSLGKNSLYSAMVPPATDIEGQIPPVNENAQGMDLKDFNDFLNKTISKEVYKGSAQLLINGEEFYPHFLVNANKAQHSIFIRLYIFTTDMYALYIADMLKRKSNEGTQVRVMIDELNSLLNNKKTPAYYSKDYIMPQSIASYLKKGSKVKVRKRLNTWATFDHSKVIIIDRDLAYTGGMNFGEEYRYQWHDMMVALRGPVTGRLVKNFYETWSFNGWGGDFSAAYRKLFSKKIREENLEKPGMINIRLLYTRPDEAQIFKAQIEAIKRAQKRIYIQNAYFSDDRIVKGLIEARGRGVDVRVILPSENDISIMQKNNIAMANKLWRNGIKVYFYNGMSHVKAALYDDWAIVGSANFDKMSLFINNEMSLGIDDPAFVKELETRLFEKDFKDSKLMDKEIEMNWAWQIVNALTNQL